MKAGLSSYPRYRKWFLLGLLVQVIAAWFSVGYHHPDEQFQILEFCNYKLGYSSASDLPWEFMTHCRSGLQPFMAFLLCKGLDAIHSFNPFIVAFLLRLFMGVLTWFTSLRLVAILLPEFITDKGKQIFVWSTFLLWFVPYIGVRFSADNISGVVMFLAVSYLLQARNEIFARRFPLLLLAGLLLGFAFSFRLQLAFGLLGVGIWIIFIQKWHIGDLLVLCLGGIVAIGLSTCVDFWLYGKWVLVPLNYYDVNIVQHKADNFGVFPWYYYFITFMEIAVPPISVVLLPLFLWGMWKKPKSIFGLICITFLAGHLFIGHKEMRFLFPVLFAFIFLVSAGMDAWIQKQGWKPMYSRIFKLLAGINIVLLIVKIFTPAQEVVKYYEFIYNYADKNNTTLVSLGESPYSLVGLEVNFYKNKNLNIRALKDTTALPEVLQTAKGPVLYLSPTVIPGPEIKGYKTENLYCLFPSWLLRYNINNWEDRSRIWTVFRIYPKS